MKNTDKFLIGLVIGIIVLVGVAFAVALQRPQPTYQAEDTPAGIAFNYLFALQQKDYQRAYGYLSPTLPGYPATASAFEHDLDEYAWQIRDLDNETTSLAVTATRLDGDRAEVEIKETHFYRGGLFDSNQYTTTFDMTLQRENGGWKIIKASSYWASRWTDQKGCS
jgi:hypothetical protein